MTLTQSTRPPLDPELATLIGSMPIPPVTITPELIPLIRQQSNTLDLTPEQIAEMGLVIRDAVITGHDGYAMTVSIIARADHTRPGPGIFQTHGGGMVAGTRYAALQQILPWVLEHDAVLVTPDYRLAPEFPDPYPIEDCYAGLRWMHASAEQLAFDADRIFLSGSSAGGGLAAGLGLLARDRSGPPLIGQVLIYPMLDDRDNTASTLQCDGEEMWNRGSNQTGWRSLLGDRVGGEAVSIYASPARATDLSGLPPTFIEVGSAEVFRDEDVAYATALWAAGVQAELHVWPGGFHGFDLLAPSSRLAREATEARNAWVRRLLD